ncbi:MAG TPA: PrsW family glutamic-type intramembrane protease [Bacillota bacterium]|nr:PrsW family glutamic-type intramembrane protease [Bacillota bacterium]
MGNFCTNCGAKLNENGNFCPKCGHPVNGSPPGGGSENVVDKLTRQINQMAGGKGAVKLRVRDLFTDIFKKHSLEEANQIFISGTHSTTPAEHEISASWPKPWLYSRVFLMFAVTFIMLQICANTFDNILALAGMMFVGALMVPFACLMLFQEVNAPRNISFFEIMQMFFVGGVASLVFTLLLFEIFPGSTESYVEAVIVGIVEELGKLAIVAYYIYKKPNIKYMLNGLLIGAAIGAGFATFETAGYIFRGFFEGYRLTMSIPAAYDYMLDITYLRAILAPGGHVAWAAINGAAIMLVKKNKKFETNMLLNGQFLKFFLITVALHAIWDMPIMFSKDRSSFFDRIFLIQDLLVIIAWMIILVLIQVGLNQISNNVFGAQAETQAEPQQTDA